MGASFLKLEIFVPQTHLQEIRAALASVDAGHIGNYDRCLNYSPVVGTWRALEGTHPFAGAVGELCEAPEYKVEVTIAADRLRETLAAVRAAHPYEEPVINVFALYATGLD